MRSNTAIPLDAWMTRLGLYLPVQVRVYAAFFLYAFSMGGFYPRLPELQVQMGVGESTLGLAIMGVAAGMLVSLTFFVPQLERMRSRTVLLTTLPVISIAFALASHMRAAVAVFFFLFLVGLVMGFIETIVNLEADRIEHQTGTRIMNRSHGFWSIGFFAGGAISAVFARFDISPQSQLWVTAGVVYLLMVLLLGRFQPTPARAQHPTTPETPRWATPTKGILLLVSVCASALLLEGAGYDWSAIYMRGVFDSSAAFAASAVSVIALAQASTRFIADQVVQRFGPVTTARWLISVLLIGTIAVTVAPNVFTAMLGFALMGVGSSAIFPMAMSAAAQRSDRSATLNVAAMAQYGFVVFLLAPPLLGFVAEHLGLRWSFGVSIPLILLSLLSSGALAPDKGHHA